MSGEGEGRDYLFKVIVIGEPTVGKTSTIRRYVENVFSNKYKTTIGVDFAVKILELDNDTTVRLQLWDIAGQERFGPMTHVYYKDASAALIVFDLTNMKTFEAVAKWKRDVDAKVHLSNGQPVPTLLLGNKADLPNPVTSKEDLDAYCKENDFVGFMTASAKTAENVDAAMMKLVDHLLANSDLPPPSSGGFRLDEEPGQEGTKPQRACCGN